MLTKTKFSFKMFLKPYIIAIVFGLIFGLTQLKLPNILSNAFDMASDCMSPVVMLLTGIVVAGYDIEKHCISLFR